MSQQLGNEVERQGRARQTSQLHPGSLCPNAITELHSPSKYEEG